MIHGKVRLRALSRALVVSSFALSAACDMRTAMPPGGGTANSSKPDPQMPIVIVTAHRLRPAEFSAGRTAQARFSQSRDTKRRGG